MDLVLQQPFPYKSLDFMHRYLQLYYRLSRKQKWKLFWPLFALLAFKIVQYLVLSLYEPHLTLEKVVAGDLLRLVGLPPETNLIVVGNLLISGYYLHLNYFQTEHKTVALLAEVLEDDSRKVEEDLGDSRNSFLISKYREVKKGQQKRLLSPYIRFYCLVVLNLLQVFILAIDSYVFSTQYIIISTAVFKTSISVYQKIFYVLLAELDIILMYLALYVFSYSHMLLGTLILTLMEILRQLMKQLDGLLMIKKENETEAEKKAKEPSLEVQASTFRERYTRTVININRTNRAFFSKVLMPLLLVNCPSNALLAIVLINSFILASHHLGLEVQFLVVMTILEQFLCIFLIHSLLAGLNSRLKLLPKRYISVLYAGKKYPSEGGGGGGGGRRSKLESHLFLTAFHTKKPYGFTYYNFGRISSFNFVKYLILYSELLMFVYKAGF